MSNNLLDILNKSVNYLEKKNKKNARVETEKILAQLLGIERIMLYANFEKVLTEEELEKIRTELNIIVNRENSDTVLKDEAVQNDVRTLLKKSQQYLRKNDVLEADLIAEIVFSNVLNVDRMLLFTKYRENIGNEKLEKIRKYIQKIGKEKFPVQYLLNEQEFYGRNFYVNKGVLIPRQDTETVVEKAIELLKESRVEEPKVLDIGTGSGVIGITVALEIPDSKVMGTDISDAALEISERNKKILQARNIKFIKSDLFENIEYRKFDMIISNPPYISNDEINVMSDDTLLHEPDEALFAKDEGLFFYKEISEKGMTYLKNKGYLVFETGFRQGNSVKKIMEYFGYRNVQIIKDIENNDRILLGQKIESTEEGEENEKVY